MAVIKWKTITRADKTFFRPWDTLSWHFSKDFSVKYHAAEWGHKRKRSLKGWAVSGPYSLGASYLTESEIRRGRQWSKSWGGLKIAQVKNSKIRLIRSIRRTQNAHYSQKHHFPLLNATVYTLELKHNEYGLRMFLSGPDSEECHRFLLSDIKG